MNQEIIDGRLMFVGKCPALTCDAKTFTGLTENEVLNKIREHLKKGFEDPIHSDISDLEGWFDTDPLGD